MQPENGVPIKAWTKGVTIEPEAENLLRDVARLPFVYKWVAVMPDDHSDGGGSLGTVQNESSPLPANNSEGRILKTLLCQRLKKYKRIKTQVNLPP
jgi:hypothetical protein